MYIPIVQYVFTSSIYHTDMNKLIIAALLLASVAACGPKDTEGPQSVPGIPVRTAWVEAAPAHDGLTYSGTVEAAQVIPLTFRTEGIVQQVLVDVGDAVRPGQVLARLDDSELRNMHELALARYRQAEDARDRLRQVYEQGSLPELKWVEVQSGYEQARASLDLAVNNMEKCTLSAPVAGIVGRRNIEPGQSSALPGGAAFELVRIGEVLVVVAVPENEINRFGTGRKARITVPALGGEEFTGETTHVSPVAEPVSRTYPVKIRVGNPGHALKPGMVCDVQLDMPAIGPALLVPAAAVGLDREGNAFVYLLPPGSRTVRKHVITTGRYRGTGIEVTSGLSEGQEVVVAGMEKLSDNDPVVR